MELILIGVLLTAVSALVVLVVGWRPAIAFGLVFSLALAPVRLMGLESTGQRHFGVAGPAPDLTSYGVFVVTAALLIIAATRLKYVSRWTAVVIGFLAFGMAQLWAGAAPQWAGLQLILLGVCGLVVGMFLGARCRDDSSLGFWLALASFVVFAGEFVLCILQLAGLNTVINPQVAVFLAEGRAVGTFNHPSVLGKVALLMMTILLPLWRSPHTRTKMLAGGAIALAGAGTVLTVSRANVIALIATLLFWSLLVSGQSIARRVVYMTGIAAVGVLGLLALVDRFDIDPAGGHRSQLLTTGLNQIADAPWSGTGPNYYSEIVGQYDPLAAVGYPVHNTFLLGVAEWGLVGAVVLFWPFLMQLVSVVRPTLRNRFAADARAAAIALFPGILLVAWTGWGLMAGGTFVLWFVTIGFTLGAVRMDRDTHSTPRVDSGGSASTIGQQRLHSADSGDGWSSVGATTSPSDIGVWRSSAGSLPAPRSALKNG